QEARLRRRAQSSKHCMAVDNAARRPSVRVRAEGNAETPSLFALIALAFLSESDAHLRFVMRQCALGCRKARQLAHIERRCTRSTCGHVRCSLEPRRRGIEREAVRAGARYRPG